MNKVSKHIVALGMVLIVVGIVLYMVEVTESTWLGLSSRTTTPYRDLGTMLLILGIIIVVVGGILAALQQPGVQYGPSSPGQAVYCAQCGKPLLQDATYCSGCGRPVQK